MMNEAEKIDVLVSYCSRQTIRASLATSLGGLENSSSICLRLTIVIQYHEAAQV